MEEAGVEVLMYVFCTDVIREGNEVKGVVIESKAGREAILARTVIDCTGDADVAFRAGVECRKGDAEGGMQPPTLMFSMRGVATQRLRDAIAEHPDIYDMDIMPAESFRNEKFITVGLRNQIAKALEDTDMVFITAGMGGGTGTGGAPIVAEIAKEMDILTVAVVTKPFGFEGRRRMQQAEAGIAELKDKVDSLVIIPNERLKHATDQKITFANAFEIADDVLRQAVQSISDLIKNTGFINLDFADVSAVMKDAGMAHMGVGRASGKTRREAAAGGLDSQPLWTTSSRARGVLVNVTGSTDVGLEEVEIAANLVQEAADPNALIIFGATFDESMEDEICVTVIATGFESNDQQEAPAAPAAADTQQPTQDDAAAPAAAPQPLDETEGREGRGERCGSFLRRDFEDLQPWR